MGGMGGGKNNYTGSSSGSSQSPGDFSATLFAEAGGYQDVGRDAEVFAKGFASHTSYDTYTDLNSNIGGVSTGISSFSVTSSPPAYRSSERSSVLTTASATAPPTQGTSA